MIRTARPFDAEQIAGIYNHYIANSIATFQEAPVTTAAISTSATGR